MCICNSFFVPWRSESIINKENTQRKFYNFCYCFFTLIFYVIMILCWIVYILELFISDDRISMLFLVAFKDKVNCHSTVSICLTARQIWELSTFSVSSEIRHSPSARCAIAANDIGLCRLLDFFSKNNVSSEDTFSIRQRV